MNEEVKAYFLELMMTTESEEMIEQNAFTLSLLSPSQSSGALFGI